MNERITKKERGLLKGAIRRVFARSDLRKMALDRVKVEYISEKHPRVKKWGYCESCGEVTPIYKMKVDHISPVIPIDSSFETMGLDKTADRTWCELNNLQTLCDFCHDRKTKEENKLRKQIKQERKKSND